METGGAVSRGEKPAATFRAKQGRYSLGTFEPVPIEIDMAYAVQWEFKLTGDVLFRTRAGDLLTAPSLTIYNLIHKRNGKTEQIVVYDDGVKMSHKGIQVTSNRLRFNPKDRTVECLTGVRGTFKEGVVQARLSWPLDDETLRCPNSAAGVMDGSPFRAESLTLDIKHGLHHASHFHIEPLLRDAADSRPFRQQSSAKAANAGQERANLDLFDAVVNEKTGVTTGRNFTFLIPQENRTVTGAKASYNKNTNVLDTIGNLVMEDPKHHSPEIVRTLTTAKVRNLRL